MWRLRHVLLEASGQMSIAEGVALGLPPHELVRCANEPRSAG